MIYPMLLLALCTSLAYGQQIDTVYYDADWKETNKQSSSYYRIAKTIEPNKLYDIADYFNSGKIQMTGTCSSLSPEVKHGLFTWYHENGNKKSEVIYENNQSKSTKNWKQDGTEDATKYVSLEKQPMFPGGMTNFYKYIGKKFSYPQQLLKSKPKGTIILSFVIGKDGRISEVQVTQSVHPLLDAEAVRVVENMPKWEPGIQYGKPVRVKYNIPIKMN